jgi:hypothetical protein
MLKSFLDSGVFNFLYPVLLLFSVIGGIQFAIHYKKNRRWENSGTEAPIIGIFGLIISFTFLTSGNAHRERYSFIHQEAVSSEMLYRYSRELPDTFSMETKKFLLAFLENHYNYLANGSRKSVVQKAVVLMDNYWTFKTDFAKKNTDLETERKLEKLSTSFDNIKTSFSRIAYSYNERTPLAVMYLLIVGSLMIGFLVGFMNGVQNAVHYLLPVVYVVFISFIMIVIGDLNNPFEGTIRPSYEDLRIVSDHIKEHLTK